MKLMSIICSRDFNVNCNYVIYYGLWNDGGECLWDSSVYGYLSEDDPICGMNVTYITIDLKTGSLVIEVG